MAVERIIDFHTHAFPDNRNIYIEISFALEFIAKEEARAMILDHPVTHILFGSDSPWSDQGETLALLKGLDLGHEVERRILRENSPSLFGPR
jgi:hypothetical protein